MIKTRMTYQRAIGFGMLASLVFDIFYIRAAIDYRATFGSTALVLAAQTVFCVATSVVLLWYSRWDDSFRRYGKLSWKFFVVFVPYLIAFVLTVVAIVTYAPR